MSEIFTIVCENIAVSAAQDILCAYASATKSLRCLGFEMAANGQTVVGNYPIRLRYLPATVTPGSVGASVTPHNVNPGGGAASFTARRNDTTQATTGGTAVDGIATQFNPINGYPLSPPPRDDAALKSAISGAIVLSLDAAPAGSINISATMWLEEI
jgi:hypothetical protein